MQMITCRKRLHQYDKSIHWECPECKVVTGKKTKKRNKDKIREYNQMYTKKNRLAISEKRKVYNLERIYGMTIDAYDRMLESQGGSCAICLKTSASVDKRTNKPRRLAVDHCHQTMRVRGLLCTGCNTALGAMDDDPKLLQRAINYLLGT